MAQTAKSLPAMQETQVRSLGWEDPLVKGIATLSSILAWTIPRTEEPGRLQSMGSQRVGHNRATSLSPQQGWGWWKGAFDSHYGNYFNHSFEGLGIRPTVSESHRPPG